MIAGRFVGLGRSGPAVGTALWHLAASAGAGGLTATLSIAYCLSYGALLFGNAIDGGFAIAVTMAMVTSIVAVMWVAVFSTMPFSVAGLDASGALPMTAMIASLVALFPDALGDEARLATALAATTLASVVTGAGLFLLGWFRAALIVRYIPFTVVAGVMAATGWLAMVSAVQLVTDLSLSTQTLHLLGDPQILPKLLVLGAFALALILAIQHIRHAFALPILIIAGASLVHAGLLASGIDIASARNQGWLFPELEMAPVWQPWNVGVWPLIEWPLLYAILPDILAVFAVASLAVLMAASNLELLGGEDANLDTELKVQGGASCISAACGGMVSALSLSRSVANREAGGGRLASVLCSLFLLAVFFIGADVFALVPKVALGGLLAFVGFNLLWRWVVQIRDHVALAEHLTIVAIVLVVARYGYVEGVVLGVLTGCVLFAMRYARMPTVKHVLTLAERRSCVDRSPSASRELSRLGRSIPIFQLQGFLFFGSAHRLLEQVRSLVARSRAVVLDFELVTGIDRSAALSFERMRRLAEKNGLPLLLTGLDSSMRIELEQAMAMNTSGTVREFNDLDQALEEAERLILTEADAVSYSDEFSKWLTMQLGSRSAAEELERASKRIELEPGDYLCRQGEPTDALIFLDQGRVHVTLETEDGRSLRLRVMEGRTVVGEMGFFLDAPRSASVVAVSPTTIFRLSSEAYREVVRSQPGVGEALAVFTIRLLAERLKIANSLVAAYER